MEISFLAVHQRCIYASLDPSIFLIKAKLYIKIASEKQPTITNQSTQSTMLPKLISKRPLQLIQHIKYTAK
jgi:hypothetical protein